MADDDDNDTGTDVSDVESTQSSDVSVNPLQSEPISQPGTNKKARAKHAYNRTGSMVIKHRTNSSLGNDLDLVNRLASRWGSMDNIDKDQIVDDDGVDTDSDYDDNDPNNQNQKKKSKKKNTKNAPNNSDNNSGGPPKHGRRLSATDELAIIGAEKEAIETAWDKYIDPEENGDVDMDEWVLGLGKLDINLSEPQKKKIYNLMDKDGSGFVEKTDFVQFVTTRFANPELLTLQQPILQSIRVSNLHDRTHSNLIGATGNSQDWTAYDLAVLQDEMSQVMSGMVEKLQVELGQEQEFKIEMDKRINDNPDLMDSSSAHKWTVYEVVKWIEDMGFERYSKYFQQEHVDGVMLLEDIDQDLLERNLGIRTIHAKKIMREIYELKKSVRGVTDKILDESYDLCTHNWYNEEMPKKLEYLAIRDELERTKKAKKRLKEFYENEIKKLQKQIIELKENQNKKGKKGKKNKKKDKNKVNKIEYNMPVPTFKEDDDDYNNSLLPFGSIGSISASLSSSALLPLPSSNIKPSDNNNNKMDNDDNDNDGDDDDDKDDNKDVSDDDDDHIITPQISADTDNTLPVTQTTQVSNSDADASSDGSSDESSDDSDDSDDDDDDDGPKHLLGQPQNVLMQIKKKKNGATAKQIKVFLKDLRKKQAENRDTFCIEDVDTIMNWTSEEVAYWISSINFDQYAFVFYSLPIDGDMLIRDMTQESLIQDCGVLKIHSNRILRAIDKLRNIINEGFDQDVIDGINIEPDLERPTQAIIDSLEERIDSLQKERDDIMKELEQNDDDDDNDDNGYFATKIKELELERDQLKDQNDNLTNDINQSKTDNENKIETLTTDINTKSDLNDQLQKELKQIKKQLRKAKRGNNSSDDDDYSESESESDDDDDKKNDDNDDDMAIEIKYTKDEINEIMMKEMDDNNAFGLIENVLDWTPSEVCYWLKNIQYTRYMPVFFSGNITGDVLLQDIGNRMLTKFNVDSMHIPKLLRKINELRNESINNGIQIQLSIEIKNEMDPNYKPPDKNKNKKDKKKKRKSKKGEKSNKNQVQINEQLMKQKINDALLNKDNEHAKDLAEKEEQIKQFQEEFEEEKNIRIGVELELDQIKNDYENLLKSGSKQQIERLQNLVSQMEESKIRTVRDLSKQLNSLRIGCRLMQKEIAFLKTNTKGFSPMDALVGALGYSAPK